MVEAAEFTLRMVATTKVIGEQARLRVEDAAFSNLEISTRANSRTERQAAMAVTCLLTTSYTRGIGRKTFILARVS